MTPLLILNPGSGSGRGRRHWPFWMDALERQGIVCKIAETRSLDDARALARSADGVDTVVAVGGDGTIGAVLTGLHDRSAPRPSMGVLYAGTSPDFCRFHKIPTAPDAALATLLAGRSRAVDVAAIRYQMSDGPVNACFGCSCNIGLGAGVAERSNRWRRAIGDRAGTALAVLWTVATTRPLCLDIEIDSVPIRLAHVNHLAILKNPWMASGLRLDVDRAPDDGRLTVVAITGRTRTGLCRLLPGFYNGSAIRAPGVFVRSGSKIAVRADTPAAVEFDGDPHGFLPADIAVQSKALDLIA